MGQVVVWKIGDKDRPATDEDIRDFAELLTESFENQTDQPLHIITHHAVQVERLDLHHGGHSVVTASQNDILVFEKGELRVKKKTL